jgi:hypothetical protein
MAASQPFKLVRVGELIKLFQTAQPGELHGVLDVFGR